MYIETIEHKRGRIRNGVFPLAPSLVAGGALLFGLYHLRTHPAPLSDHARKVAELPARMIPDRLSNLAEFYPLSDREILILLRPSGPQTPAFVDQTMTFDRRAFRIDLQTGNVREDRKLAQAITGWPWHDYRLSPDRRSLLCLPNDWKHPGRIVNLRTHAVKRVSLPPRAGGAWYPDSRSVVAFAYDRSLPSRLQVVRFGLTPSDPTKAYPIRSLPGVRIIGDAPAYVKPDGTFVCLLSFQDASSHPWHQTMHLQELRPEAGGWTAQPKTHFDPPNQMVFDDAVRFRPDGKRILWQAIEQTTMTTKHWMLYTANADGSDRRRIGTMPVLGERDPSIPPPDPSEDDRPPEPSFGAEWMPDGKTICFIADGAVYLTEDR